MSFNHIIISYIFINISITLSVIRQTIIIGNFNDRDIYFCPAYTICKYENRVLLITTIFQAVRKVFIKLI